MTGWRISAISMRGGDIVAELTVELVRAGERRTITISPAVTEDDVALLEAFDGYHEVELVLEVRREGRRIL